MPFFIRNLLNALNRYWINIEVLQRANPLFELEGKLRSVFQLLVRLDVGIGQIILETEQYI